MGPFYFCDGAFMKQDFLWVEKYRPRKIEDTILPADLKSTFQKVVDSGEVPNMLLTGTAGLGKTTVARAICEELDCDYIVINASMEGNIDTLRGKIAQFASSVSLTGGYKVIILDEADYLNPNSTQPALRGFIEDFSNNCRFILTCNFKNRIIEPLHSRCGVYEFNTTKETLAKLCGKFFSRLQSILDAEGVTYNEKDLAELVKHHAPDWRRILNEAQRLSMTGTLELGSVARTDSEEMQKLMTILREKKFNSMRTWVANNIDADTSAIFSDFYRMANTYVKDSSIPNLVVLLNQYQYNDAFVADHELNLVACFTEVIASVEFKEA